VTLSVIIVNYNVKNFLKQCLYSAQKASEGIDTEFFVVDNHSVDGSVEMIKTSFPDIHLIANNENLGFAKACNQALKLAKGKYALLLNPDTVVQENTFRKCIEFMDTHPEAGGLGVRMINGNGKFLPESKRSLPTPWVSFYKIFGLSALFPKSKKFGKYHLKYLDEYEIAEIEVLAGAYMFMRMEVLKKIGFLDERFFMYGEDIDLSYRILKAGYKNYYLPETSIIHYKGESTKKGSLNYVKIFYQAMSIYANKHFSGKKLKWYILLIQFAIYFRAGLSMIKRIVQRIFLPVLDFLFIFLIFKFTIPWWASYKYGKIDYFPDTFIHIFIPAYILIWLFFAFLKGAYGKHITFKNIIYSVIYGGLAVLIIYSLLPEHFRFSRFLVTSGSFISLFVLTINRLLAKLFKINEFSFTTFHQAKSAVIMGSNPIAPQLWEILKNNFNVIGYFAETQPRTQENYLGSFENISELINLYNIERLIFVLNEISVKEIIERMTQTDKKKIEFLMLLPIKDDKDFYIINVEGQDKIKTKLHTKKLNNLRKKLFSIFNSENKSK